MANSVPRLSVRQQIPSTLKRRRFFYRTLKILTFRLLSTLEQADFSQFRINKLITKTRILIYDVFLALIPKRSTWKPTVEDLIFNCISRFHATGSLYSEQKHLMNETVTQ